MGEDYGVWRVCMGCGGTAIEEWGSVHPADKPRRDALATAVKEAAIRRVTRHTDPGWATLAYLAVQRVARERRTFTASDLWLVIESRPREPRALAGVLRRAVKNGLIEATGEFRKSGMRVNHDRPQAVWRSLVYKNGEG